MRINSQIWKLNSPVNSNPNTEQKVIQERLRQAKLSFNAAFVLTATSAVVSLGGAALLLLGNVPEGIATTSGGLASNVVSVRCLQLAKDTNDRLDKMARELDHEN